MFLISKLFTAWFLPPGLFITVMVIWAMFSLRKKKAGLFILMLIYAGFIYGLSITPVSNRLILPLENSYTQLNIKSISSHDVYVVLGGGVHDKSPDLGSTGSPMGDTLQRLVYAFRLYRIQPLPIIVSSGKSFKCQAAEAPIMKRYLVQMGIHGKDIYMDTTSRNTYENAVAVKRICKKIKCRKIILITSAYHMKRAVFSFRHVGLTNIIPAPSDYKTNRSCYNLMSYMPSMGALLNSYRALHEYIGTFYYKLM